MSSNKNLNYYLSKKYPFSIETLTKEEGGGYFITYPDLPGCMSDGETKEEAIKMGEDACKTWIKARHEDGYITPELFSINKTKSNRVRKHD